MNLSSDLERMVLDANSRAPGLTARVGRFVQIAKYYRWRQIAQRGWNGLRSRFGNKQVKVGATPAEVRFRKSDDRVRQLAMVIANDHATRAGSSCENLMGGQITLLHESRPVDWPMDWRFVKHPKPPHLWRFQLHYHEYFLGALANCDNNEARTSIWSAIQSWLKELEPNNSTRADDAWHPYCISRRVQAWLWILNSSEPPAELRQQMQSSLWQQTEYLFRRLERDLGGNHLVENLTAITLVAALLESPESGVLLEQAGTELIEQLDGQILEHGEHFERSPMYHCQILGNVLAIAVICRERAAWISDRCRKIATDMVTFLSGICHPDGEIPLFGDSGFGEAISVSSIKQLAKLAEVAWPNMSVMNPESSPYWCARHDESLLVFDCGEVGADALPAHAHCDLLGFEASLDGERWFVDSGNFNYEDDSIRGYCRSSIAHNVVTIDRQNQCDVWSKFRMGSRGKPSGMRTGMQGDFQWACASHDAYRQSGIPHVWRLMAAQGDQVWLCADWIPEIRSRKIEGWLHLSPQIQVHPDGNNQFRLEGKSIRKLDFFGVTKIQPVSGWYCHGFGVRELNSVLCYELDVAKVTLAGWVQTKVDADVRIETAGSSLKIIERKSGTEERTIFEWDFAKCI